MAKGLENHPLRAEARSVRFLNAVITVALIVGATASVPPASSAAEYPYGRIPAPPPGPPLDESTVVTLQRGPCFGNCSEYTVKVYGSGRIEFEGRRFVCAKGRYSAWTSPADVRTLVEQMLAFGYLDLYWRSGSIPTLSTTVISSLRHGERARRIEHAAGDPGAPQALTRLEEGIDKVAGTWRWLPEHEDDRRVCRREDGETELLDTFIQTR